MDTNILIDVLEGDSEFGVSSATALAHHASGDGALIACGVVWAEVATVYQPPQAILEDLAAFGLRFDAVSQDAALTAADVWARYREAGGKRGRIAADFLIGAYGVCQADRLLTRDAGFHRQHFTGLRVETPDAWA